jgi:hypothetical protein
MLDEFNEIEQIAFIIGNKIAEFYSKEANSKLNEEFSNFVNDCLLANRNIHKDYYSEDLQYALRDIKAGNNPSQVFLINPFFKLTFEKQYVSFINNMNQIVLKQSIDTITDTVNMMAKSGYNLKKLVNFPFDKISSQLLVNVIFHNIDKYRY